MKVDKQHPVPQVSASWQYIYLLFKKYNYIFSRIFFFNKLKKDYVTWSKPRGAVFLNKRDGLKSVLSEMTAWFWGFQYLCENLTIFEKYLKIGIG